MRADAAALLRRAAALVELGDYVAAARCDAEAWALLRPVREAARNQLASGAETRGSERP